MAAALGKGGTNALFRKPETVDEHLAVAGGVEVKLLADDGVVNLGEERIIGGGGIRVTDPSPSPAPTGVGS